MAVLNLEQKAPATDKRVLATYWLLAETPDLESALKNIQFELDVRAKREAVSRNTKDVSAARRAEIEEALRGAEVYDVEADGGL